MVKPIILKAKDFDDMEDIAKTFIDNGYKIFVSDAKFILVKKRNFGKWYFHILFLAFILFFNINNLFIIYAVCILYIVYFLFCLFKKSKNVIITTELTVQDGNLVEFDDINDIDF